MTKRETHGGIAYVIERFNEDVHGTAFKEQLAADVIYPDEPHLNGIGFHRCWPLELSRAGRSCSV